MKVRSKIQLALVLCTVVIALSIVWASGIYSSNLIRNEAKEKLTNLTISHGIDLNDRFNEKEFVASSVESFVRTTIDMDRLYEPGYLDEYEAFIEPFVKDVAVNMMMLGYFLAPI